VFWHRIPHEVALPKARAASEKALSLDPDAGESYGVLVAIFLIEKNLPEAEKNLTKAIDLNPNNPFAYERLGWTYMFAGKSKEAISTLKHAIELDPLSTRNKGSVCTMYYMLRKYDEGIALVNEYLKTEPTDNYILWSLSYLQAGKGEYQNAMGKLFDGRGNIITSIEKLKKMGAKAKKALPENILQRANTDEET
jgi:tetratricopeptide (TPR) repeat protein